MTEVAKDMDGDCLFCKIIDGSVPSKKVYENEWVLAFEDISPAARVHVLLVPKKHFADILAPNCGGYAEGASGASDARYVLELHRAIKAVVELTGVAGSGFRVIANCGRDAGQTVPHLHFHILGGQPFGEALL
ncbi:MAG: histidine triad nucleotide-binding protein [Clostridiales bacterium]|jgi:histidine triad (HIT) family protein|nr:histidine triad nucleotide-binding protein [Clostridiales bacterium]